MARAIFASNVPVISAVGHEVDYTISDFVSDLRAPTPTGAAEMAVPNVTDLQEQLLQYQARMKEAMHKIVNYQKIYFESLKTSYVLKNPNAIYEPKKQQLDLTYEKLRTLILTNLERAKNNFVILKQSSVLKNPTRLYDPAVQNLRHVIEKLEMLNPLSILGRGYTLAYQDEHLVKTMEDVKVGESLQIRMQNGIVNTKVLDKKGL